MMMGSATSDLDIIDKLEWIGVDTTATQRWHRLAAHVLFDVEWREGDMLFVGDRVIIAPEQPGHDDCEGCERCNPRDAFRVLLREADPDLEVTRPQLVCIGSLPAHDECEGDSALSAWRVRGKCATQIWAHGDVAVRVREKERG